MLSFIKVTIGFRLNTRIHSAARTAESVAHQSALISISTDPREMDLQVLYLYQQNIYTNGISISTDPREMDLQVNIFLTEYLYQLIIYELSTDPRVRDLQVNIYINKISISMEYISTINEPEGNGPSGEPFTYV